MSGLRMKLLSGVVTLWAAIPVWGDEVAEVYITLQQRVNGVETVLHEDISADAGVKWTAPIAAPKIEGHIFTHWNLSTSQEYVPCDDWGCARDVAEFVPYENTIVTANYLPEDEDSDADGVPDGWELYWYGTLDYNGEYDSDGDGISFAAELAQGSNPHFPDVSFKGLRHTFGDTVLYNPENLQPYTFKSEPEGELFSTIIEYARPGQLLTVPTVNRNTTRFAYWTRNGMRVTDDWGRSVESITFAMPTEAVVYTAVCADGADKEKLYWYGRTDVADDTDTDGDGFTFAEEIAQGTNPLFPDASITYKGVVHALGDVVLYNPDNMQTYTFRSEPEGELFATISDTVKAGTKLTLPTVDRANTRFAYWTCNGNRLTDEWGRSVDNGTVIMPSEAVVYTAVCADEADKEKLYWYGRTDIADDSDTDGDGFTFAEEITQGTNPLFPDARITFKGVVHALTDINDINLQIYEHPDGVLMDGAYQPWPIVGANACPAIGDWDGDGVNDLVVASKGELAIWLNVGTAQNPNLKSAEAPTALQSIFAELNEPRIALANGVLYYGSREGEIFAYTISSGTIVSVGKCGLFSILDGEFVTLNDLVLDTPLIDALSISFADDDGDGLEDLFASDTAGRIWYYQNVTTGSKPTFKLRNKVWGGSYDGFASGLTIAATDWDDDGDVDAICGTAEGRVFYLNDPRGGRPSNFTLAAGADSVTLKWDPSAQARIRGYNVYRASHGEECFALIDEPKVPKYLDKPEDIHDYDYRVTSVSRFYKTGNSKPTIVESVPTETLSAALGKVAFTWQPAVEFSSNEVRVDFAIENALHVAAEDLVLKVVYDSSVLVPLRVERSGITSEFEFSQTKGGGMWLISGSGGAIAPGSGTFLTFVFAVADATKVSGTQVSVSEFTLKSVGHENLVPVLGKPSGDIGLEDEKPQDDSYVPSGSKGDLNCDGRLSWEDVELFLEYKDRPNAAVPESVRVAGDFNGDGVLDNRDYGLLKAFYSQKAKTCPSLKGWDKNHGYKGVDK